MFNIEMDEYYIFPLDYLNFIELSYECGQDLRYTKSYNFSEKLAHEVNRFASENTDKYTALDMSNIGGIPLHLNYFLEVKDRNIIIFNVDNEMTKAKLEQDYQEELKWLDNKTACAAGIFEVVRKKINNETFNFYRRKELNRIVNSLAESRVDIEKEEEQDFQQLHSTGLFCNYYIDIKKLFVNPRDFHYIIFNLASLMYSKNEEVDAIITSSRNGAVLASILGGLLRIKEVHLVGIGPKYAARLGDSVDCIRKGKRYAYIFDFMCTGTELKLTNALINSKKAYLTNSFGIARLYKEMGDDGAFKNKIFVLTDTKEAGIDYKVAATKKDLYLYVKAGSQAINE